MAFEKASAARNSARMSSSLIICERAIRPRGDPFNTLRFARTTPLEAPKAAPIEPPTPEARVSCFRFQLGSGVSMRRIGWAIALAAAWLTPAAAQAPATRPAPCIGRSPATTSAAFRPERRPARRTCAKPDNPSPPPHTGQELVVPAASDGRSNPRASASPTAAWASRTRSPRSGAKRPPSTTIGCSRYARSSAPSFSRLLLYAMIRFRRSANPMPSRNSHNTTDRGDLDAGPGADPGRDRDPVDPPAAPQVFSPPPADLTVKVTGHQWYWSYELPDHGVSFDSYMLKEKNDPTRQANQRSRTDADGPPLARRRPADRHSRRARW